MTMNQREKELKQMEEFAESIKGNRELAIEFLVGAGIITRKGNLRRPYRGLWDVLDRHAQQQVKA